MSLTLATLRSRVGGAIGLSTAAGTERDLIDGWLNEAIEQFLIETKCKVQEAVMNLTASEDDYTLPVQVLAFKRLWIVPDGGASTVDLAPAEIDEIRDRRRYASTGSVPAVYRLEGTDLLMIAPAAQANTDVLHMLYVPVPSLMTAVNDTPLSVGGIPSWGHPAIEEYAKWKAADWDDDTSSQIGERYQKGWDDQVKKARSRLNRLSGGWSPARPGGRRRRLRVPTSPGVDTGV